MTYHLLFAFVFFSFILIRIVYHRKAKRSRHTVDYKESNLNKSIRAIIGLTYTSALLTYIFYPSLLNWASFVLPGWTRWLGVILSILSVCLIWWVQWALGVQFDTTMHIQADHQLISHGPYHWVRHPMYTSLFLMGIGWLLLTANVFVGGSLMTGILFIIATRVGKEEAILIEEFGDSYRTYIRKTGRFLPPLIH